MIDNYKRIEPRSIHPQNTYIRVKPRNPEQSPTPKSHNQSYPQKESVKVR